MKRDNRPLWLRFRAVKNRETLIHHVEHRVVRQGYPRFQMLLIMLVVAGSVFLTSFLMWHLGVNLIWLRYLVAMCLGYAIFMGLLFIWLKFDSPEGNLDLPSMDSTNNSPAELNVSDGGGDAAGGGASGSWGDADVTDISASTSDVPTGSGSGFDLDLGELGVVIALIAAAIGVMLSSLYVIYIAPTLLAELSVDVLLALYSHHFLRQLKRRHWLESAFKKTIVPFLISLAVVVGGAFLMHSAAPEAQTLSQFLSRDLEH